MNRSIIEAKRKKMIDIDIIQRGITDSRIISAMSKIPRERFIPPEFIERAYDDCPLPIAQKQTISQPYIVALMTQLLQIKLSDKVLEVGTGSGYQTAILGELAEKVYTIECFEELQRNAQNILEDLEYKNILYKTGNGLLGWQEKAPFDRIILTASPEKIPYNLLNQLNNNGVMVAPIGKKFSQVLYKIEKDANGKLDMREIIPVSFVPMLMEE